MSESIFVTVHKNQSTISCVVAMILAIGTLTVTIFLSLEIANYEKVMKYTIYRAGYEDALSFKQPIRNSKLFAEEKIFQDLDNIFLILKVTCGMGFVASALHFLSSLWTMCMRSPLSVVVWMAAQFIAVGALVTAIILPNAYELKAVFLLGCFYAILSVDIFITVLLLIVVLVDFMGQRSAYQSQTQSNDNQQDINEDINKEGNESTVSVPVETETEPEPENPSHPEAPQSYDETLPLPPPPPPPTTTTTTTTEPQQATN